MKQSKQIQVQLWLWSWSICLLFAASSVAASADAWLRLDAPHSLQEMRLNPARHQLWLGQDCNSGGLIASRWEDSDGRLQAEFSEEVEMNGYRVTLFMRLDLQPPHGTVYLRNSLSGAEISILVSATPSAACAGK
jgi:hypothetical protein